MVKHKQIYVNEEDIKKLKEKFPSSFTNLKKEIINWEKRFNDNVDFAEIAGYKFFSNIIKQEIFFDYPNKKNIQKYVDFSKINKTYLDILQNKNIFNNITEKELDKKIVREYGARKTIFLCANGRLVKNSQIASYNLLINDEAGTGKDYVTSKTLEILPEEIYIKKTRISPSVFTYWHNSQFEPDWTWDGKVFYTEDISENILNSEVFKVMCSSGSSATIVIKQRAIEIDIKGKPVMITTTANSIPSAELTRRFEIVGLNESIDQTKEIMKRHCEYAIEGISPEYNIDYTKAICFLKRVNVKIPFAKKLYLLFPHESIIMRTKFPRFLDFIKASASFHQFQRDWEDNETIIANDQDYEIACEVMKNISSNRYLVTLTKRQKRIMDFFEKSTSLNDSFCEGASKIRQMMGNFISLTSMCTNLNQLSSYGLLSTHLEETDRGKEVEKFFLNNNVKNGTHTIIFPKFEDLIKLNGGSTKPTKPVKATKSISLS